MTLNQQQRRRLCAIAATVASCVTVVAACQPRAPELASVVACDSVSGVLPIGTGAERLAGTHQVTLIAVRGPFAGRSITGRVWLTPFDSASPYLPPTPGQAGSQATYPLHGRTDLALDSIGAQAQGATNADPASPGVLVIVWEQAAPQSGLGVTLRFGAEANRPGVVRFDGAFTALHVAAISDSGFAGAWVTGGAQQAGGGHFCAWRAS